MKMFYPSLGSCYCNLLLNIAFSDVNLKIIIVYFRSTSVYDNCMKKKNDVLQQLEEKIDQGLEKLAT